MREKFIKQLRELNVALLEMGHLVEKSITMAVNALLSQNVEEAQNAIKFDEEIDRKEREIESMCFQLLLLQQPVAKDLRFVSAAFKMITDMERIGDHAADISEITIFLSSHPYIKKLDHIRKMATETTDMVMKSIEAYVENNENKARAVMEQDDVVDELFNTVKSDLIQLIHDDMDNGEQAMDLLMVAKYFERIGDHATNIAEWVVYSISGQHVSA